LSPIGGPLGRFHMAFSVSGPASWHSLPPRLRDSDLTLKGPFIAISDTTQLNSTELNSTSSWVELRRYKRALSHSVCCSVCCWLIDSLVNCHVRHCDSFLSNAAFRNSCYYYYYYYYLQVYLYYPNESFPEVYVTLHVRRKYTFFITYIIFPCLMLSSVLLMVFLLPADSGEKVSLGVSTLVAISVFLLLVAGNVPDTSDSVPLLGQVVPLL